MMVVGRSSDVVKCDGRRSRLRNAVLDMKINNYRKET